MDGGPLWQGRFGSVYLLRRRIMEDSKSGPVNRTASRPKGRWALAIGGAIAAVASIGLLMQYVRGTSTNAASDPPAGQARVGANNKKPEALARVGKDTITYDAVAEECVRRYGREVLEDLIHRLIIQQACEERKISVTDQEITDEIDRIAKKFKIDVAQWQQMLQAERNITPLQYRQSVIYPMIALRKLAGDEVEVTEKEIKEGFIRNYGPRVKARMIFFDKLKVAQEHWDEIHDNPENFEEYVKKYSIDPSSRSLGGQVPPIPRFAGNDELEKAAFKLKKEEVSGVIEVPLGRYVIVKCEGRTEPVVTDIEEVKDVLYEEIKESKTQAAIAGAFEKIKSKTSIDNYLAQTSFRPETNSKPDKKDGVQPTSGTRTGSPKTVNRGEKENPR
jgi:foldase protein PrsA